MFCCTLLYVHSSTEIILMGKRELVALLNLSSWCPLMVKRLFLAVPQGCLRFVIVVLPDHTRFLLMTAFNFHLTRHIVGFMVGNFVLRRRASVIQSKSRALESELDAIR